MRHNLLLLIAASCFLLSCNSDEGFRAINQKYIIPEVPAPDTNLMVHACGDYRASNFHEAPDKTVIENGSCVFELCPFEMTHQEIKTSYDLYKAKFGQAKEFINLCSTEKVDTRFIPQIGMQDIIWVVDNSASMTNYHQKMADQIEVLLQPFSEFEESDVNMMMINTDFYHNQNFNDESYFDLKSEKYIENPEEYMEEFGEHILVGGNGLNNTQAGLSIQKFLLIYGQQYIRENAQLVINIISNQAEESEPMNYPGAQKITPNELISQLKAILGTNKAIQINAIVDQNNDTDHRYQKLTSLTGGKYLGLANPMAHNFQNLGSSIASSFYRLRLNENAYSQSINVFHNNLKITDWTYHKSSQEVMIDQAKVHINNGDEIKVTSVGVIK